MSKSATQSKAPPAVPGKRKSRTDARPEAKPASAVERTIGLIRRVAALPGEASLIELSEAQGLSRSVTYKLLQIMVANGLVRMDPDRKTYCAGLGLYNLATTILHQTSFIQIARANMRALVERTGESACLNLLDTQQPAFTVAAVEESAAPLQYVIEVGLLHPLHAGASGKAILAFQPEDFVRRVLSHKLTRLTAETAVDATAVREQLARIRKMGYCVSIGERLEGAVGIAAPVLDHGGRAIGSVQLTIPRHRYKAAMLGALVPSVTETATQISAAAQSLPSGG